MTDLKGRVKNHPKSTFLGGVLAIYALGMILVAVTDGFGIDDLRFVGEGVIGIYLMMRKDD